MLKRYLISNFLREIISPFEIETDISDFLRNHDPDRHLEMFFKDIYSHLNSLRLLGIAALLNINLTDFIKFKTIIPNTFKFKSGNFSIYHKKANYEGHEARFCLKYIIDYALFIQSQFYEECENKFKKTLNDI